MNETIQAQSVIIRIGRLSFFSVEKVTHGETAAVKRDPLPCAIGTYEVNCSFDRSAYLAILDFVQGRDRTVENWENEGGAACEH